MSDQSHLSVQDLVSAKKKFIVFYNMLFSPQHSSTGAILKSYGFEAFGSFCSV